MRRQPGACGGGCTDAMRAQTPPPGVASAVWAQRRAMPHRRAGGARGLAARGHCVQRSLAATRPRSRCTTWTRCTAVPCGAVPGLAVWRCCLVPRIEPAGADETLAGFCVPHRAVHRTRHMQPAAPPMVTSARVAPYLLRSAPGAAVSACPRSRRNAPTLSHALSQPSVVRCCQLIIQHCVHTGDCRTSGKDGHSDSDGYRPHTAASCRSRPRPDRVSTHTPRHQRVTTIRSRGRISETIGPLIDLSSE